MGGFILTALCCTVLLSTVHCFLELSQGQLSSSDVHALQTRLEEEKAKRILLQSDLEVLMGKVAALERAHTNLQAERNSVGFTATLSQNVHLSANQRLIIDNVVTNIGNGYDARHGFFRPPVNGTYLFILSGMAVESKMCHLSIYKNDKLLVRQFAGSTSNGWAETGTVSVVTDVSTTDEVWVQSDSSIHDVHSLYTTFTGLLLSSA